MGLKKGNRRAFWQKLRDKYRLSVYNTTTYEEVFKINLSRLNVFAALGSIIILTALIVITTIAYTPLKEFIPGFPDGKLSQQLVVNQIKLDSIENKLILKDRYLNNLKTILSGGVPDDYVKDSNTNNTIIPAEINYKKSKEDSILRVQIESEDRYTLNTTNDKPKAISINTINFFPPVKGMITSKYEINNNHLAVDIVSKENSPIMAILDGNVVFTGYTKETGYIIYLQHKNNILSVYKHVKNTLVKQGDYIKKGKVIATMGNTGTITSGPHLHFELWNNGTPVNPEDYISFE